MLTYRVMTEDGNVVYQGTNQSDALKVAASLYDDCSEYRQMFVNDYPGDIECRDVKECGHYGHSTWLWRKPIEEYLDLFNLSNL